MKTLTDLPLKSLSLAIILGLSQTPAYAKEVSIVINGEESSIDLSEPSSIKQAIKLTGITDPIAAAAIIAEAAVKVSPESAADVASAVASVVPAVAADVASATKQQVGELGNIKTAAGPTTTATNNTAAFAGQGASSANSELQIAVSNTLKNVSPQ